MITSMEKKFHWTQRVALVRHNLHAARRTGDFTFFKTLQAQIFLDGTDHLATLTAFLGDEADTVLSTLDNLNAGIAYVHQDAFKNVYDNLKASICDDSSDTPSRRAKLRVDASQQKQMADFAIDKMTNSSIALVQQQPLACQDAVAAIWVTGTTIIADAVKVCLDQTDRLERCLDDLDFIQLEYAWSTVQSAVDAAISALRGVFNLMAPTSPESSTGSDMRSRRASSSASFGSNMFRRLSTALSSSSASMAPPVTPPYRSARNSSVQSLPPTPTTPWQLRASMSAACPTAVPARVGMPQTPIGIAPHTLLTPIPPTPACVDEMINPFDGTPASEHGDYFKARRSSPITQDDLNMDNVDPLTPVNLTPIDKSEYKGPYNNVPDLGRRLSNAIAPAAIAV